MTILSPILRSDAAGRLAFWCPGCEDEHAVRVGVSDRPCWGYNGNPAAPTFTPSLLVTYNGSDAGQVDADGFRAPPAVCHSFITNGRIQFLGDCTHALAGQTVDIPEHP